MSPIAPHPLDTIPDVPEMDLHHMVRTGWLPKTAFPALEELRQAHEKLISTRHTLQGVVSALRRDYKAEDEAWQAALDAVYRDGTEPPVDKRTSPEQRKAELEHAEAHATAAARAVIAFCKETLYRLRGCEQLPDGWNPWLSAQAQQVPAAGLGAELLGQISNEESALRDQISDAQRIIDAASLRLREYHPLKHWIAQTANGGPGQIQPGYDLPVPSTHTPMSKPRDLNVPGWHLDDQIGDPVYPEGREDLIPDDVDSAVVEQSDPYFLEQDRQEAAKRKREGV